MERLHWVLRTPDSAHAALIVGAVAIALGGAALFAIVAHTITPLSTQRVMGFVPRDSLARVELVIPAKPGEIKGKGLLPVRIEAPAPTVQVAAAQPAAVPDSLSNAQWEGPPPKPVVLIRTSDANIAQASLVKREVVQAAPESGAEVIEEKVSSPEPIAKLEQADSRTIDATPVEPKFVEARSVERTRSAELAILEANWTKPLPPQPAPTEIAALPVAPKIVETSTVETKHAPAKVAGTKHVEPKHVEPRHLEPKHTEPKAAARLAEAKSPARTTETKAAAKLADARRIEARPAAPKLAEAKRIESKTMKAKGAESRHVEPKPAANKVVEARRSESKAAAKIAKAERADLKPVASKAMETKRIKPRSVAVKVSETKAEESRAARLAETRRLAELQASEARWAEMKRTAELQAAQAKLAEVRHAAEVQAAEAKLADAQHAAEMRAAEAKLAETKRQVESTLAEAKLARAKLDETRQAAQLASNPVRPAAARYAMCETCGTVTSVTMRAVDGSTNRIEVRVHFLTGDNLYFVYPNDPGFSSGDHVRMQGGRLMRM